MQRGIIYLFETGIGIKIGRTSRQLSRRMKELSIILDLTFVHAISCHNVAGLERMLHEKYRHRRVLRAPSREIFALSFADVMTIKAIQRFNGRDCKHFDSLAEAEEHSFRLQRHNYLKQYG